MPRPPITHRPSPSHRPVSAMIRQALSPAVWSSVVRGTAHGAVHRYRRATSKQKVRVYPSFDSRKSPLTDASDPILQALFLAFCVLNVAIILTILIVTPHRIGLYMQRFALTIRSMRGWGAALLFLMVGKRIQPQDPLLHHDGKRAAYHE